MSFRSVQPHSSEHSSEFFSRYARPSKRATCLFFETYIDVSSQLRLKFPRQLLQQKETKKRSNATKNASYLLVGTRTIGVWNHYVSVFLLTHSKYTISFYTVQCAPGTYSGNGVEPCSPCPFGTYQPGSGQIACLPCPGQQSTHGTGASLIDFCGGNTSYCFFLILKPKGTWCLLSTVYFKLNITGKIIFLLK